MTRKVYNFCRWSSVPNFFKNTFLKKLDTLDHYKDPDPDMDIHNMWQEGDGPQDMRFYLRDVEAVLRELIADERLEGCQHYAFK